MSAYLTSKQRNKMQHSLNGNLGFFGGLLGEGLGYLGEQVFGPTKGINGRELGRNIGSYLPFARGGKVPARQRGGKVLGKKRGGRKK